MLRRLAIIIGLLSGFGISEAVDAASTINPNLPQDGVPYSPAPIRQNFQAAANDIVALQTMNAGASPPSNPTIGTLWLNTPQNGRTYTLNIWDGPGHSWLPIAALDTTNNVWMPPVGGGLLPNVLSAQTSDLGAVPQAALNLTGNNTVFSFGASAPPGIIKFIIFASSPTLVFNATSMILPTGANAQPGPGDVAIALHLGQGKWKILFITQHGSVPGEADLRIGLGLTAEPGTDNSTPVNLASGTLYGQIFPRDFANSHTILPDDMAHLLTASAGGLVAFTLPPAGGLGFESGVGVCFEANGVGGFTLQAEAPSALLGIPLTAGIATVPQFGSACAVSDGTNWNVTSSIGSSGPPPTIPDLDLGLGFTKTPGSDNITPLVIGTDTLYGQIIPTISYTSAHTVLTDEVAHIVLANGTGGGPPPFPAGPYDIEMFWPGVPPNNAIVRAAFTRAVTCLATLSGSVGNATAAATASTTININQVTSGTRTLRGTAVFAMGATTATFTAAADIHFAAADDVEFAFPASADATLADIAITLQCTRN